jgi:hypothetical protein
MDWKFDNIVGCYVEYWFHIKGNMDILSNAHWFLDSNILLGVFTRDDTQSSNFQKILCWDFFVCVKINKQEW